MTSTDSKKGWGWVLGTRGEQTRCYPAGAVLPPCGAEEAVEQIAQRLGLPRADVEQILERIDRLQREYRAALRFTALARYGPSGRE
ncbi:hypothetical protein ACWC5I_01885 [Kitasatospora sp. NPDC001574]